MIVLVDRFGWLTAVLAGALAVTAFAPFGWYPLVLLSLAVLFNQWLGEIPRRAFITGYLFGLGFFGAGISWVYVSIHHYGHVPVVPALLVMSGLVAFLSLYPAAVGYCIRRLLPGKPGWATMVLALPAGWILSEWVRGWLFSGFPWLTIGSSQVNSPLSGYAPVAGVFGTGLVVAVSAGLLLAIASDRNRYPSLGLLVVLWAGGLLLDRVEWTQPRGAALDVALVQGNIAQEDKWATDNLVATLGRYSELTFALQDIDVVVWPETAIPAFYHQVEDSFIPYLQTELQAAGMTLLTGIPVLDRESWDYYNSVISINTETAFYSKQHLVPYGEYLPLRDVIGDTLDALAVPNADFTSGTAGQPLLHAAGYPVATSVCYEVIFGEQLIRDLPEAAMLVNVSNDAWFGGSLAPHQHLEMARMRARETGRPMLRATNTGISAIIDYRGNIMARSAQDEEVVLTGSVIPRAGATPYVRVGNMPVITLCVALLLMTWVTSRKRSSR
ncbi:MAG: apolipoprotein N-acyltransferase [Gammaproteobacteria bacterium]|nr:MAG: apolipoprotein N-acyltransferase [Gammaproteobacteria bacterium]